MSISTYGESFFDGPGMAGAKAPLIGGGVAQLGIIATKKFLPSQAKWAGAIGAILGSGAAYLLKGRLGQEGMGAAIAAALIVGLPRQLNDMTGGTLMGDDFGAITAETLAGLGEDDMAGYLGADAQGMQLLDSGSGGSEMGVVTAENFGAAAAGVEIQGSDFGATGIG
jgi:hypothetical protein